MELSLGSASSSSSRKRTHASLARPWQRWQRKMDAAVIQDNVECGDADDELAKLIFEEDARSRKRKR